MKKAAILLVVALTAAACKSKSAPEETAAKPEASVVPEVKVTAEQAKTAQLQVVQAARRALTVDIEVSGEIASDTDQVLQVRPEKPGIVREALVAVGDTVEPGQALLRYQPENGDALELKAPQRGVVVGLYAGPGAHVDRAAPVATIADTSRIYCGLDVYEKDIARVRKGQSVRIKVAAFQDETFSGDISYVSPRVDENSRTVKVRVDIANPQGKLKFGMFVKGFIQVGQRQALAIPESAVQVIKGKTMIFVGKPGEERTFTPVEVKLGDRSNDLVEILSGVKDGDRVAVKGSFTLKAELSKGELGEGD